MTVLRLVEEREEKQMPGEGEAGSGSEGVGGSDGSEIV